MAEKRMINKSICDSDAFLDFDPVTQNLYFHLNIRADDEGFIDSPNKIVRLAKAKKEHLDELLEKRYIIGFESGVIVIKHWKLHNAIRKDRLKNTMYQEEKNILFEKDDGAYTLNDTNGAANLIEASKNNSTGTSTLRQEVYKNSSLPYSFGYKIVKSFYGKECPLCKCTMQLDREFGLRDRIPTVQHNQPISKGGRHELDNISIICKKCNVSIKDNETADLNMEDVVRQWDIICQSGDSQSSDKCPHSIDEFSLVKDSIEEVSIEESSPVKKKVGVVFLSHNSDVFKTAFNDFVEMRNGMKPKMTDRAKELVLIKLDKHDELTAITMLHQSIENSWKGLFEVKDNNKPQKTPQHLSGIGEWAQKEGLC